MKPRSRFFAPGSIASVVVVSFTAAGFLTQSAFADYDWNNGGGDFLYSNPANWAGTSTDNNFIDNGDTVIVNSVIGWNPNDLKIAAKGGSLASPTSGTLQITSGSLSTNYWTFVGDWAGNATLNVAASTTSSPGTYTGLDQGTGSYTSGALNGNGNIHVGLYGSTGVFNVNTSGTVTASGLYVAPNNITNGGALPNSGGTFNLDAGTVNISGDVQVGSDFWGAGDFSNGQMNMSGGTMNVGGLFEVGHVGLSVSSGTSNATVSGGILNVENDLKLGFAGNTGTTAEMDITDSGVVNVGSSTVRWVILGQYDPTDVSMSVSNGGTLNLNAGTDVQFAIEGNTGTRVLDVDGGTIQGTAAGGSYIDLNRNTSGGTSTMTIQGGGLVAVDSIIGGSNTTLNFDNGTLQATADDANFIGGDITAVNILSGGAILDSDGHNVENKAAMAGAGGLTKNGAGTLTMSGASTYTGATSVSAGTLYVTGSLGATDVTVANVATIGGGGTIGGNVHFDAGAAFDFAAGTLTVNGSSVSFGGFGIADLENFSVSIASSGGYGVHTLIDGSFTLNTANLANLGEANAVDYGGGYKAWFEEGSLNLVVVPEPGAALLGSLGMLCLLRRRRSA